MFGDIANPALCLLVLLVAAPLQAQTSGVTLSGTVSGASHGAVASATVRVTNVATGKSTETVTDQQGHYSVPNLAPANYDVSVSAVGFQAQLVSVTIASAGRTLDVSLPLTSGAGGLTLQDLGFSQAEARGNPQEQATLDKRSHMLKIHQRLGLITAVPMFASIFTGSGAKIGRRNLTPSPTGREIHTALGVTTTALYLTTAYFAIRAPKIPGTETRGHIRFHKAMAWIHGPGMVLTPTLGAIAYAQEANGQRAHGLAKWHGPVAITTFGAFTAAMISVSIK